MSGCDAGHLAASLLLLAGEDLSDQAAAPDPAERKLSASPPLSAGFSPRLEGFACSRMETKHRLPEGQRGLKQELGAKQAVSFRPARC